MGSSPSSRVTWMMNEAGALLVLGIAVHLVFFSSVSLGFLNPLADDTMHRRGQGVDFYSVYQAGRNVIDGVNIYAQKPEHVVVPYHYPYRYHPLVALTVGLASNLVTPALAYTLWILLQEFFLALNVIGTRKLFQDQRSANIASALWLLFFPLYLELYMGQFSFLMASLVFWMIVLWQQGRTRGGDVAWTTSLFVKSNTGIFLPVLVKLGRWKLLAAAAAVVGVVSFPYFVMVPGSLKDFAGNITEPLTVPTIAGNQGFAALLGIGWLRLSGLWPDSIFLVTQRLDALNAALPMPVTIWTLAVLGSALAVTVRARRQDWMELFTLWMVAYFLFYKHIWEHQYVMVLPVFVVLLWRRGSSAVSRSLPAWTLAVSFVLAALPTAFVFIDKTQVMIDPEYYWSDTESLLFHMPKPISMLLLYVSLSIALWRAGSLKEDQPVAVQRIA
jgi:hypothetical protein